MQQLRKGIGKLTTFRSTSARFCFPKPSRFTRNSASSAGIHQRDRLMIIIINGSLGVGKSSLVEAIWEDILR